MVSGSGSAAAARPVSRSRSGAAGRQASVSSTTRPAIGAGSSPSAARQPTGVVTMPTANVSPVGSLVTGRSWGPMRNPRSARTGTARGPAGGLDDRIAEHDHRDGGAGGCDALAPVGDGAAGIPDRGDGPAQRSVGRAQAEVERGNLTTSAGRRDEVGPQVRELEPGPEHVAVARVRLLRRVLARLRDREAAAGRTGIGEAPGEDGRLPAPSAVGLERGAVSEPHDILSHEARSCRDRVVPVEAQVVRPSGPAHHRRGNGREHGVELVGRRDDPGEVLRPVRPDLLDAEVGPRLGQLAVEGAPELRPVPAPAPPRRLDPLGERGRSGRLDKLQCRPLASEAAEERVDIGDVLGRCGSRDAKPDDPVEVRILDASQRERDGAADLGPLRPERLVALLLDRGIDVAPRERLGHLAPVPDVVVDHGSHRTPCRLGLCRLRHRGTTSVHAIVRSAAWR